MHNSLHCLAVLFHDPKTDLVVLTSRRYGNCRVHFSPGGFKLSNWDKRHMFDIRMMFVLLVTGKYEQQDIEMASSIISQRPIKSYNPSLRMKDCSARRSVGRLLNWPGNEWNCVSTRKILCYKLHSTFRSCLSRGWCDNNRRTMQREDAVDPSIQLRLSLPLHQLPRHVLLFSHVWLLNSGRPSGNQTANINLRTLFLNSSQFSQSTRRSLSFEPISKGWALLPYFPSDRTYTQLLRSSSI